MELLSGTGMIITLMIIGLMLLALPIMALVSLARNQYLDTGAKVIWALIIFFLPLAGPVFYFVLGRRRVN